MQKGMSILLPGKTFLYLPALTISQANLPSPAPGTRTRNFALQCAERRRQTARERRPARDTPLIAFNIAKEVFESSQYRSVCFFSLDFALKRLNVRAEAGLPGEQTHEVAPVADALTQRASQSLD